jgi:hypothetical protein
MCLNQDDPDDVLVFCHPIYPSYATIAYSGKNSVVVVRATLPLKEVKEYFWSYATGKRR